MSAPLSTTFQRFLPRRRRDVKRAQVIVATLVVASVAFLIAHPFWERAADLRRVASDPDEQRVARSMLRLCKNTYGQPALESRMAQWDLERRVHATSVAASLGCVEGVAPVYRAEFYLREPSKTPNTVALVALGPQAIEPALRALGSSDQRASQRALVALAGLSGVMNRDQKRRVLTRLRKREAGPTIDHVRALMGAPSRAAGPTVAPTLPAVPQPTLKPAELGDSLPKSPGKVLYRASPEAGQ